MSRWLKALIVLNLLGLAALVAVYPHLMLSPGRLIPGHAELEQDCFACHQGFRGATSAQCTQCHAPASIGKRSTSGQPLQKPLTAVAFHQQLQKQDCMACHSDHAGVRRAGTAHRFKHELLRADARRACATCHTAPADPLHRSLRAAPEGCTQCHTAVRWRPASFDHTRYFELDRDHRTDCVTCHTGGDYTRYTCYGCHEHTPDNIRREHIEEGIRNFKNCTECHRNADEHDIRQRGEPERKRAQKRGEREHD